MPGGFAIIGSDELIAREKNFGVVAIGSPCNQSVRTGLFGTLPRKRAFERKGLDLDRAFDPATARMYWSMIFCAS